MFGLFSIADRCFGVGGKDPSEFVKNPNFLGFALEDLFPGRDSGGWFFLSDVNVAQGVVCLNVVGIGCNRFLVSLGGFGETVRTSEQGSEVVGGRGELRVFL